MADRVFAPAPHKAIDVCQKVKLKPRSRRLLTEDLSLRGYYDRLLAAEQYGDCVRFMAAALPKRAAVWWGGLCLHQAHRQEAPEGVSEVLRAIVQWVQCPSEENRRRCETIGRGAGLSTAHGALAMAAFWSGGSMSHIGLPTVRPPEHLTARMTAGSILLTTAARPCGSLRKSYRRFLHLGLEVANGKLLWIATQQDSSSVRPRPQHGKRAMPRPQSASVS